MLGSGEGVWEKRGSGERKRMNGYFLQKESASLHLSVITFQLAAAIVSFGNSFDPIPTAKTPALNQD